MTYVLFIIGLAALLGGGESLVRGVDTTVAFTRAIIADPVFQKGDINTGYIEDFFKRTPVEAFACPPQQR